MPDHNPNHMPSGLSADLIGIDESLNTPTAPITTDQQAAQQASLVQSAEFLADTAARRKREGANGDLARLTAAQNKKEAAEVKARATKEEMLGASPASFVRSRDTDDALVTFVPCPPKLGALPEIMGEISVASSDAQSQIELIFALTTTFLYIKDAKTSLKRRATVKEIAQCMEIPDLDMLKEMCERYLGISMGADDDGAKKK